MKQKKTFVGLCREFFGETPLRFGKREDLTNAEPQLGIDYTQEQLRIVNETRK